MAKSMNTAAAAVLSGCLLTAGTLLLPPVAHADSEFDAICRLIKYDYYSRDMVVRGLVRVTPGMTEDEAGEMTDLAVSTKCPEALRLAYYP